jgi:hypothetical protein
MELMMGLLDLIPIDVQVATDRRRLVAEWLAANEDMAALFRKKTKDELIVLLLDKWIGHYFENTIISLQHRFVRMARELVSSDAYQVFLHGTDDEATEAIEKWRNEAISSAGGNKDLIVEIAQFAGGALDRIRTRKFSKGLMKDNRGGRKKGAQANRLKADKHLSDLRKATFDYFRSPASSGKSDGDVADFLMQWKLHCHPSGNYTRKTMIARVKKLREEFVNGASS